MATTYSSGSSGERKVITTDLHNGCTSGHTGTSASAPMAAGVVALVLEANPELRWRDVQHITIRNAQVSFICKFPHFGVIFIPFLFRLQICEQQIGK